MALALHLEFGPGLHLAQWLYSIRPGEDRLDLMMAQRLISGSKQKGIVLEEIIPNERHLMLSRNNIEGWNFY